MEKSNESSIYEIDIVNKKDTYGDPGAAMTFLFTMITFMFWGVFAGIFKGKTELVIGLFQLACFPGYLIGAILYYCKGQSLNGHVFLIFATLFGGIGGISNVATHFGNLNGWGLDGTIIAIPFLWGAISLIPVLIVMRKLPIITFSVYLFADLFIFGFVFLTLGLIPLTFLSIFVPVIKWLAFLVGALGTYVWVNDMLKQGGCKSLPLGPSIFK